MFRHISYKMGSCFKIIVLVRDVVVGYNRELDVVGGIFFFKFIY